MIKLLNIRIFNRFRDKSQSNLFIISLLTLGFGAFGCQEIEPTAVLEVNVIDKLSELRDSVQVSIYDNQTDWQAETNPYQKSQYTDRNGRVRFFGLSAGEYFVDTKLNDSLSNLEGKTTVILSTEGSFSLQPITLIVDKNTSEILTQAGGKTWRMTRAELFELDYTEDLLCLLDDELIFHKGNRTGKYTHLVGDDLCEFETSESGTWTLNEGGTTLTIETENGQMTADILFISTDLLVLRQTFDFDIFEYDVYYEVVQ